MANLADSSKIRIEGDKIKYRLYAQDGSMIDMETPDTAEHRRFVAWVQIHDRMPPVQS